MYALLNTLRKLIDRQVANTQTLRQSAQVGDTMLYLQNAKFFEACEKIAVYRDGEEDGELHTIKRVISWNQIELEVPLSEAYTTANTRVTKTIEGDWVRGVYIGDPQVIPRYPAITIAPSSRSSEWLTIESTSERHELEISIYTEYSYQEKSIQINLELTKLIERGLYFSFYPLVERYCTTFLTEDVDRNDTIIRVDDDNLNRQFVWFFIESDQHTRPTKPKEYRDNGVIELTMPIGENFSAGDEVIFPGRHFYDSRPESTNFGTAEKGTLLYASRINYFAIEERLRPNPYYLPINKYMTT